MILCPDCGAEHEANDPFCLSCGHRFVFTKKRRHGVAIGDTVPEGQSVVQPRLVETEQHPSLTRESTSSEVFATQVLPRSKDSLEGERTEPSEEIVESSVLLLRSRTWIPIFVFIFASLTIGISLFLLVKNQKAVKKEGTSEDNIVISIPEGKTWMGLSDEAKAVLLLVCQRSHKEENECEESKLFENEGIRKQIYVPAFRMDKYEVSNQDFANCVKSGQCIPSKTCKIRTHEGKQFGTRSPKVFLKDSHPVVCISAQGAKKYCESKGGGLPSSAHFLRASRMDSLHIFPWGNHWDPEFSNWGERDIIQTPILGKIDGFGFSAPIGSFKKGCASSGICDLAGNVAEWGYNKNSNYVYRGGSWTDLPFELRVSLEKKAKEARTDVGFRCVYPLNE